MYCQYYELVAPKLQTHTSPASGYSSVASVVCCRLLPPTSKAAWASPSGHSGHYINLFLDAHLFFGHAALRRPSFFSRAFGCGTSTGSAGTLPRMSGSRPRSAARALNVQSRRAGYCVKGLGFASLRRIGAWNPHSIWLSFNSLILSLIFVFAPLSRPLFVPSLLSATAQLHAGSGTLG